MPASQPRKATESVIDRYIGKQLRSLRIRRDMSEHEFAVSLDVSLEDYQRMEDGKLRLSASDLFVLKRAFDVPLSYFFSDNAEHFSDIILEGSQMADVFHYFSNIEDSNTRSHLLKQIKLASNVF